MIAARCGCGVASQPGSGANAASIQALAAGWWLVVRARPLSHARASPLVASSPTSLLPPPTHTYTHRHTWPVRRRHTVRARARRRVCGTRRGGAGGGALMVFAHPHAQCSRAGAEPPRRQARRPRAERRRSVRGRGAGGGVQVGTGLGRGCVPDKVASPVQRDVVVFAARLGPPQRERQQPRRDGSAGRKGWRRKQGRGRGRGRGPRLVRRHPAWAVPLAVAPSLCVCGGGLRRGGGELAHGRGASAASLLQVLSSDESSSSRSQCT